MKAYTYITAIIFSVFIISCGEKPMDDIAQLKEDKSKLESKIDSLKNEIQSIDDRLAEIDTAAADNRILVKYNVLKDTVFSHHFEIYGQVETDKNILLYPESAGLIKNVKVQEGQIVKKGQSLANIDSEVIRNQISEVQTSYDLANTTYEKQERLWKQNIGSEIQYLQAKNRKEGLEATLKTLRSQLSKSLVKAPFTGTIDEIFSNTGEMANPGMPLMRLVNLDQMYITCEVSEQYLGKVNEGTPVRLVVGGEFDDVYTKVDEVSNFINPENRSFKIRVPAKSTDGLKPNLMTKVVVKDYENPNTLMVKTSDILQNTEGQDFVYILQEEADKLVAKQKMLDTGKEYNGFVEVLLGLESGDRVISEGNRSVRNNQEVRLN